MKGIYIAIHHTTQADESKTAGYFELTVKYGADEFKGYSRWHDIPEKIKLALDLIEIAEEETRGSAGEDRGAGEGKQEAEVAERGDQ